MAIQEVRVGVKDGPDAGGLALQRRLVEWGIDGIVGVRTATVYRFEEISDQEAHALAAGALVDPITQTATVNAPLFDDGAIKLEIGYKPGVMNPVEESLLRAAGVLGIHPSAVSSSAEYYLQGQIAKDQLETLGKRLASQVEIVIWEKPEMLIIHGKLGHVEDVPVHGLFDTELVALSDTRRLFLNTAEMRVIQNYYDSVRRSPTDVELEMLAQTWSEHCGHKTFKAKLINEAGQEKAPLIRRIIDTAKNWFEKVGVVTAFTDNAGGMRFYDGQVIIAKGETHNSPVAVEPYGGSMTKNGGVYRDIAGCGLGGTNILALMVNCMGFPDTRLEDVRPGCLHPKSLLLENFRGERDYGNQMGIPTLATSLHFHPDFGPKPTSMGIVVGIAPEAAMQKGEPLPGDFVVSVGGKTGRDGIHGATFSSGAMTAETSTVDATAVQIGNAIEEKRMFDALIACREAGVIRAITDCGAGGYSSAVGEMGKHVGVQVHLENVPLKYTGLSPWEIWISESQERMVVAIDPKDWGKFKEICDAYQAPACVLGEFTGDNQMTILYEDRVVGQLPMDFLHDGLPQRELRMEYVPSLEDNAVPELPTDWITVYKQVLGHLNIASTELMLRQFDTTVQARTVLSPFSGVYQDMPNDAVVLAPIYGKPYGVVVSHAVNPILNRLDPYKGTQWTIAHAASKYGAVGGNIHEAAMIDNFVWPKPTPKFLGDLDRSTDALCDMTEVLGIPPISGKDSLSSTHESEGKVINIPPVLNITLFGRIPDVKHTVSADIKSVGSTLVLIGKPDVKHLGGSIYFQAQNIGNSHQTEVDIANLPVVLDALREAIRTGKVKSCKAVGEGGLATTVAHMCFGGDCGATIDLSVLGAKRLDFALFQETAGSLITEVANEREAQELFGSIPHVILGRTMEAKEIVMKEADQIIFTADLYELKQAWQGPFKEVLSL